MLFYKLKKKSISNKVGLYTQEQVDELEKRIDELGTQLCSARASLVTYSEAIKHMTAKDSWFDDEMRMDMIRRDCDKLLKEADECEKVMHVDWS